jgi:DNA polymerase III subunit gamma/tau
MRRTARYRGFKSHPFRQLFEYKNRPARSTCRACFFLDYFRRVSYQSLYRRYRPQRFGELQGQEHVAGALRNAVRDDTVLHAYLFSGPRGTGKTSSARILAKALNCTNLQGGEPCCECQSCLDVVAGTSMDVIELDAASNNGVDAMRDLVSRAALGTAGRRKVYIVDEVHMLSTAAANALLKTLEEPPDHVVFVLATTDPQKVLQTIISRTQHFEFRLAALDTLTTHLQNVASDAGIELDPDTIQQVARKGNGSFRDALSALDQVAALGHLDQAAGNLDEILDAIAARDAVLALSSVGAVIDQGRDPRQVVRDLIGLLRECFLSLMAPGLSRSSESAAAVAQKMGTPLVVRSIEVLGDAGVSMRDALDPRVNLEVALVKLVRPDLDSGASAIMARLDRLEAGGFVAAPGAVGVMSSSPTAGPSNVVSINRVAEAAASEASEVEASEDSTTHPARPTPSRPQSAPLADRGTVGDARAALTAFQSRKASGGAASASSSTPSAPPSTPGAMGAVAPLAAPAGPVSNDLGSAKEAWMGAIESRMTKAMFNAGRFVSVTDADAVFALPNDMTLQRCQDKFAEVSNALNLAMGRAMALQLVVDTGAASMPDDPEGAAGAGAPKPAVASPAAAARTAIVNPDARPAAAKGRAVLPGPDDSVDLSELTDVPETSPIDAIMTAFPGTEIIDSPNP